MKRPMSLVLALAMCCTVVEREPRHAQPRAYVPQTYAESVMVRFQNTLMRALDSTMTKDSIAHATRRSRQ